jgi:hypothetical protein
MSKTSSPLHTSPSGEPLVGDSDGDTLLWNATLDVWEAAPGGSGATGATGATGPAGPAGSVADATRTVYPLGVTVIASEAQLPAGRIFDGIGIGGGGGGSGGNKGKNNGLSGTPFEETGASGGGGAAYVTGRWTRA